MGKSNQWENHEHQRANYHKQSKMLTQMHKAVVKTFGEDKLATLQNKYGILLEHQPWELYDELYKNYVKAKDYGKVSKATTTKMNVKWDPTTLFGTFLCQQQLYKQVLEQCGDTIDDSIMIRQSLPSSEDIPNLELACGKWNSKDKRTKHGIILRKNSPSKPPTLKPREATVASLKLGL